MELSDLYRKQKDLDEMILNKVIGVTATPEQHYRFLSRRFLAAFVELGELANECEGSWKYWKQNPRKNRTSQLKEYVDLFHFFLSVGNTLGFEPHEIENAYNEKYAENILRQQNNY